MSQIGYPLLFSRNFSGTGQMYVNTGITDPAAHSQKAVGILNERGENQLGNKNLFTAPEAGGIK